jgi:hypothetical protein
MNLTAADGAVNFTLAATDAEGDPLRFAVYQTPSNGTLIGNAPHLFYAAEPGFAGEDMILFTVSDNRTETWIGVVFIQIGPESASEDTDFENEDEMENEPGGNEPLGNTTAPDTEVIQTDESQPVEQDPSEESTTKARADKSNVLVMVSWDHHEQEEGLASTLHLKFAEHRTREELDSHIWYDLVMLDESKNEILRKNDLVALNSEDVQEIAFPTNGTYHFEVNVKGLVDKSNNEIIRDSDYTGKALGTVVVPEFNSAGVLLTVVGILGSIIAFIRSKAVLRLP